MIGSSLGSVSLFGIRPCKTQNGQNYIPLLNLQQAQQASSTAGLTSPYLHQIPGLTSPYLHQIQQTPYGKTNNNKLTECPSAKNYTERSITIYLVQCSPFIKLCLGSIGMDCVICVPCLYVNCVFKWLFYKGIIGKWPFMVIFLSFLCKIPG